MRTLVFVAASVLVLAGLFVWLKPSEPPPAVTAPIAATPAVKTFAIELRDGKLAAGPAVISVTQGERVTLHVTSNKADELHLHGYDLSLKLLPAQPAELNFVADRSGRFDYELHHAHHEIGALEVAPR